MTTATGSPTWLTSSLASAQCGGVLTSTPGGAQGGGLLTSTPGGAQAIGSGASRSTSVPTNTACTPGYALAAEVSIETILACASGERTNDAHSCPVTLMSSM